MVSGRARSCRRTLQRPCLDEAAAKQSCWACRMLHYPRISRVKDMSQSVTRTIAILVAKTNESSMRIRLFRLSAWSESATAPLTQTTGVQPSLQGSSLTRRTGRVKECDNSEIRQDGVSGANAWAQGSCHCHVHAGLKSDGKVPPTCSIRTGETRTGGAGRRANSLTCF